MGTRGTKDGATTGDEYFKSPTLQLHGPKKEWVGNICYADNHVETGVRTFYPSAVSYECGNIQLTKDNIFGAEFACYGSSILAKQKAGVAEAKWTEFSDACRQKTARERVECALAANDLDAVAKCDSENQ